MICGVNTFARPFASKFASRQACAAIVLVQELATCWPSGYLRENLKILSSAR
jgi:hypothetical protein